MTTHSFIFVRACSWTAAFALGLAACSGATGGEGDDLATDGSADDDATGGTPGQCGNGTRDGDEACDGTDLGGNACAMVPGFVGGDLGCTATCTLDTSACEVDPDAAVVRINEVTASDITEGEFAGAGDAIELHNVGGAAADLSGWRISDEADLPDDKTYAFPAGTTLAPGGFLVIVRLDDTTGEGDYPFGISSSNPETLTLVDAAGTSVDVVDFLGSDAVVSWCRVPDGTGTWQTCMRTFGGPNMAGDGTTTGEATCGDGMAEGTEECDGGDLAGLGCVDVNPAFVGGTLACSDACTYDPSGCEIDPASMQLVINELTSSGDDTIELFNAGDAAVDLSGYILTDDLAAPTDPYDPDVDLEELTFAAGTSIGPGEFLTIDGGDLPMHPFGLSSGGDTVTLMDPTLAVVDFVAYGADEAVDSYCRMPDGPAGAWQPGCTPTFGAANR